MSDNETLTKLAELDKKVVRIIAERDAWIESARQYANGCDYYKGLIDEAMKLLGPEAFRSDDGSVQDEPLRAKLPELVQTVVTHGLAEHAKGSHLAQALRQAALDLGNVAVLARMGTPLPVETIERMSQQALDALKRKP